MVSNDGTALPASLPTTEELPEPEEAFDLTLVQPGTRTLVRHKPIGYHCEIDNKLQRWVFERIILWRVEGILFVATPDFELCIEQLEWWAEFWLLQNRRYPPCAHDYGRNLVHHFHRAFNVVELTELVFVARAKAQ